MNKKRIIKDVQIYELKETLALVHRVFNEFEAPDYEEKGVEEFRKYIDHDSIKEKMLKGEICIRICKIEGKIAGVIAVREHCHISLLFVDKQYHRQGIAKELFNDMLQTYKNHSKEITVNSSPYAVEVYRRLGFCKTGEKQTLNSIIFIPMSYKIT